MSVSVQHCVCVSVCDGPTTLVIFVTSQSDILTMFCVVLLTFLRVI